MASRFRRALALLVTSLLLLGLGTSVLLAQRPAHTYVYQLVGPYALMGPTTAADSAQDSSAIIYCYRADYVEIRYGTSGTQATVTTLQHTPILEASNDAFRTQPITGVNNAPDHSGPALN